MDQISPPMRIVLAVAVVFLAAYMLVLKPKDDTAAPAATPSTPATPATASAQDANKATTGLGKAVEAARGARDATEAEQNREDAGGAQAGTANPPSASAAVPTLRGHGAATQAATQAVAPKPSDPALAELPRWLQRSVDDKVVAILFTNHRAADDRRTARSLRHAFTAHGKVVKRQVPLSQIARYRPVADGVDVQQSPTLMVIDRDRGAQALVGYSSVNTINQAIIDGLLATDRPVEHVAFLQTVQRECRQISRAQVIGPAGHAIAVEAGSLGALRNAPAPRAYRGLKRTTTAYLASDLGVLRAKRGADAVADRSIVKRNDRLQHRAMLELNAVGVSSCN